MVSSFSRVDELHETHNLVRHGYPKDRFCFNQTGRMPLLVVFTLSCDLRNNSEVRRVLTVLVPTVHPQTNSELGSWWLAHVTIHHRHMTNPTMDFFRDNGFDSHKVSQQVPNCPLRFKQDRQCIPQRLSRRKFMVADTLC